MPRPTTELLPDDLETVVAAPLDVDDPLQQMPGLVATQRLVADARLPSFAPDRSGKYEAEKKRRTLRDLLEEKQRRPTLARGWPRTSFA